MNIAARSSLRGFTLIELLTALLILSLLALMSYRGLSAVLDARVHIEQQTEKWRHVTAFFARFEHDVQLAAPRPVRTATGTAPAWLGQADAVYEPRLTFSRFTSSEGMDTPRRIAYRLNEKQQIELWLWPVLDMPPASLPVRYPVLSGVTRFEMQYLDMNLNWINTWPSSPNDTPVPRAIRLRIVLTTGEDIVRIFTLTS